MSNFNDIPQISVHDLPGALQSGENQIPLEQKDVAFPDQDRSDESMIREATSNRFLSEAFESSRGLIGIWNVTELMLRAYVEPIKWKGSDQLRSHLGIPLLAENFYSMLSVVQQTLFSGYRPFQIDPTSDTSIDTAQANEALITAQLKRCGYKGGTAKQEIRAISYDGLLYGTGCGFIGWETKTITVKRKRKKNADVAVGAPGGSVTFKYDEDDVEDYNDSIEINHPILEHVPIRRIRVSPDCRRANIQTAQWAGRLIYLSSYELDTLRDVEGYNIPTRDQLVALSTPQKRDSTSTNPMDTQGGVPYNPVFQNVTTPTKAYPENYEDSTVDPLAKKWEIFEYWTDTRVAWILEGQYCIRNESHDLGRIPFLSFAFREAPDSFYGYGLGFWLTDFQRIAQGITNAFLDDLNLNLMGTYTSPAGLNNTAQAQWIFPGKVFKSDGQNKVEAMTRNSINAQEPLSIIAQCKDWASQISGAGPGVQGANPGAAGNMRTPAGVNLIAQGESVKQQDLLDQICDLVFVPFLEFCIEQNRKLKPSQVRAMLSAELGKAFKAEPIDVINGDYKVTISAGTKLAARAALNQSIGFIQSIITSPGSTEMLAQQAMKIDYVSFVKAVFESTGYPYQAQIIVPMDDADKQRVAAAQQQPGQAEQLELVKGQVKQQVDDNQAENRILIKTGETALKHGEPQKGAKQANPAQEALNKTQRTAFQRSDAEFNQ